MKNKNKQKILRFISVFSIISILFVVFAFPISAESSIDIGNGVEFSTDTAYIFIPDGVYINQTQGTFESTETRLSYSFNLDNYSGNSSARFYCDAYFNIDFKNTANSYGTLKFTVYLYGATPVSSLSSDFALIDSSTNEFLDGVSTIISSGAIIFTYTGYLPERFYCRTIWNYNFNQTGYYTVSSYYDISYTPKNETASILGNESFSSFGDSQSAIDNSQAVEDDSLSKANGFIQNTVDFVFDRSLFTEGGYIHGLRVASTTFENFASIPFIGTILKYAVIFGLIGFVLGLATFVMRRRN